MGVHQKGLQRFAYNPTAFTGIPAYPDLLRCG